MIALGWERGGHLVTAGETIIIGRIQALRGDPARLFARLTGRAQPVSTRSSLTDLVADVDATIAALVAEELVDAPFPWARDPEGEPLVRVRHVPLVRRLERWALLSRHRDRSTLVVQRLGHVRWPIYAVTAGASLHRDRRAFLAWDSLREHLDDASPESLLDALEAGRALAPGALSLRGSVIRRVLAAAARRERDRAPGEASALYDRLSRSVRPASIAVRRALASEAVGHHDAAVSVLRDALSTARPDEAVAIHRTGRRIGRTLGRGWAPDPPLREPKRRDLLLPGKTARRPLWGDPPLFVEPAVVRHLSAAGRTAVHAEGVLWTTVFALLMADEAYFLPIPGMLPTRWLSGPLDVGTTGFAGARKDAVARVRDRILSGRAPEALREAAQKWRGITLAGCAPDLADGSVLSSLAEGLGPRPLLCVLDALLQSGFSAARGLPDLVVLPGEPTTVPELFPSVLPASTMLVELKTPADPLRDGQRVWLSRLREAGADAEVWQVRPRRTPDVL